MKSYIKVLVLFLLPVILYSQAGTVAGKVSSTTGETLPGVNVVIQIQALTLGSVTDPNGNFTISNVPAGKHKVISRLIGYRSETKEINVDVGQIAELNFALSTSAVQIDEVVVTGAGSAVEKMKLGNTVSTISSQALKEAPITSFSDALSARVAGVMLMPTGGLTGEGAQIRIRGNASLSQSNEPIVYVDGIRVDNGGGFAGIGIGGGGTPSRLDDINPASIERVEILKGAAAATLYGSQANAGVIQIFTKQGSVSPLKFNFEMQQSSTQFSETAYKKNAGFARDSASAARMSTIYGTTIKPFEIVERTNVNDLFDNSFTGSGVGSSYSLSASGGGTGVTYFINGRYMQQGSPISPQSSNFFDRTKLGDAISSVARGQMSATINVVPTDAFRLRLSTMYSNISQQAIDNNNNIYAPVTLAQFSKPELVQKIGVAGSLVDNAMGNAAFATVREGFFQETKDRTDHGNVAITGSYNIGTTLTLETTAGIDYISQRSSNFNPFGWNVDRLVTASTNGELSVGTNIKRNITFDSKAIWNTNFAENLSSQLILGLQAFQTSVNTAGGYGQTFPGPGIEILGAGQTQTTYSGFSEVKQLGYLVQNQLGYEDYAYLTAGVRLDANSAFGTEFKTATYPKVSLSFLPIKAGLMPGDLGVSTLRLRAALGSSGQQPGAFDQLTTYVAFRAPDGSGVAPGNLGNPQLKPETSTEIEFGAEIGLLDDQLALEFTSWNRVVKDALVARAFAPSGGFYRTQLDNIGELTANGLDLQITYHAIRTDDFSLSVNASAANLTEKITNLGGAPPFKVGGSYPRYRNFTKEGFAPGAFFGPKLAPVDIPIDMNKDGIADTRDTIKKYVHDANVGKLFNPGTLLPLLLAKDGVSNIKGGATPYLEHYLGKPTPDWQGSFGTNMTFMGNIRLNTVFEYKFGEFYVHNLTDAFRRAHPTIGRNLLRPAQLEAILANPASTADQRVDAAIEWVKTTTALSPYDGLNEVENIYLVRLREISLTYDVPAEMSSMFGVSNASVTFSGRNLMIWTDYSGTDPEINEYSRGATGTQEQNFGVGIDAFGIPIPKQYFFTLRFGL